MATPVEVLAQLRAEHSGAAADIAELEQLYSKKLWHQLTVKLDALFKNDGPLNQGNVPLQLFEGFISDWAHRANLLKVAQFAVHSTKCLPNPAAVIAFLKGVQTKLEEMKQSRAVEPILFVRMQIAQQYISLGQLSDAKGLVESGKEQLEGLPGPDPSVSAAVYYVNSLYAKAQADYASFYRASLMYLSFVSSDSLPADFKVKLAVDISLAALLGEGVYSFGQLLQHPIVGALDTSSFAWLHELLRAFNAGDLAAYDVLCKQHALALNAQPALVAHERRLREKITLMALLELVSSLPAEQRTIPLSTIATATQLNVDGVEFLLMKALSLHLLEGVIDQVAGQVNVTWVTPRILTKAQIAGLQQRLDGWVSKVASLASTLEEHSLGVTAA